MTADEAIKIKEKYKDSYFHLQCPAEREADRLSIEALKEVKAARIYSVGLIPDLLPGETKD